MPVVWLSGLGRNAAAWVLLIASVITASRLTGSRSLCPAGVIQVRNHASPGAGSLA
jgi:hypothetical protein